jgi:hypothetical protein
MGSCSISMLLRCICSMALHLQLVYQSSMLFLSMENAELTLILVMPAGGGTDQRRTSPLSKTPLDTVNCSGRRNSWQHALPNFDRVHHARRSGAGGFEIAHRGPGTLGSGRSDETASADALGRRTSTAGPPNSQASSGISDSFGRTAGRARPRQGGTMSGEIADLRKSGKTIIKVTRDPELAGTFGDSIIVMRAGKIVRETNSQRRNAQSLRSHLF